MSAARFYVETVGYLRPLVSNGFVSLGLSVSVTETQRREIAEEMIGGMEEKAAYEWVRRKFPEWFEEKRS